MEVDNIVRRLEFEITLGRLARRYGDPGLTEDFRKSFRSRGAAKRTSDLANGTASSIECGRIHS